MNNGPDYLLLKYDSSGNLKWNSIYNITVGEDWLRDIKIDSSENIYVTGTSNMTNSSYANYFTIKYDSSGNILWTRSYSSSNGPISGEEAFTLCIDHLNNIHVSGKRYIAGNYEIFTIKYDTNGDTLWAAGYGYLSPNYFHDFHCSCDAANNLYLSVILSSEIGFNSFSDIITLKYGSTVNVDEFIKKNDFMIYPNPTNDFITIHYNLSSAKQTTVSLFNLYGQLMATPLTPKGDPLRTSSEKIKIDMRNFPAGIYFVKVRVGEKDKVRKVVKY
jgi:hypothetical protein